MSYPKQISREKFPWTTRRSNQLILKEINPEYSCKNWCWSWSSNTLATWCEELTHWKRLWCWERLKAEEKGMTEDGMVGWHHWLNEQEFGQTTGDSDGQESLVCCNLWGHKESDMTEWQNNNKSRKWDKRRESDMRPCRCDALKANVLFPGEQIF